MRKARLTLASLLALSAAALAGYAGAKLGDRRRLPDAADAEPAPRRSPGASGRARRAALALTVLAVCVLAGVGGYLVNQAAAQADLKARASALTGGDPDAGARALARRPCRGCHQIPGVPGATGKVGPSLAGFAGRIYIGGRLPNTADNLQAWIIDPHAVDPQNVMPPTGVGRREARDIAAYLYTLQ